LKGKKRRLGGVKHVIWIEMRVAFGYYFASPKAHFCSVIVEMWHVPHLKTAIPARIFKKHFSEKF